MHALKHKHTHTHSITAQRLNLCSKLSLSFCFLVFFVFDTCFRFGDVQFLSCLLIVKVAEALFNSFRNTFVALFVVVAVVVAVKLVAVVASGSAIDMDMPRPWPVRVHACLCACMRATFARPKCKMREGRMVVRRNSRTSKPSAVHTHTHIQSPANCSLDSQRFAA